VSVDDVEPPDTRRVADTGIARGARITRIDPPDSPAARAGLKPNDVIIEFNGAPVSSKDHLVRMVGFTPVGSEASITYLRKQVKRQTKVILADRREAIPANPVP
jgi:S1-C subfamily serine protease